MSHPRYWQVAVLSSERASHWWASIPTLTPQSKREADLFARIFAWDKFVGMAGRYTGSYLDRSNGWRAVAIPADIGQASLDGSHPQEVSYDFVNAATTGAVRSQKGREWNLIHPLWAGSEGPTSGH